MRARTVVVEVDDLNGRKANVGLDAVAGSAVPVSHLDRHQTIALRVISVETDAGSEVDRITGEVVEKITKILDTTAHDHAVAAADLIAGTHLREVAWREALVEAAAHLLHAIHQIDKTRPVEVRADDLRSLLDRAFVMNVEEDEATARLRDALEGPR